MTTESLIREVKAARRMPLPPPALARAIRLSAGLSQQRMAAELGVERASVARWELGRRRPRGPLAIRYAEILAALRTEVGL